MYKKRFFICDGAAENKMLSSEMGSRVRRQLWVRFDGLPYARVPREAVERDHQPLRRSINQYFSHICIFKKGRKLKQYGRNMNPSNV